MGLMYRKGMAENHGLLLTPCNEIHTFGMNFDIDTVALSKIMKYCLLIGQYLRKGAKKVKNGYKVLELCSGVADKLGLAEGDVLDFK